MRFNLFQTISENIINKFSSEEGKYFNEQFNKYFTIEDALFCYKIMDEGYKPSSSKIKRLNEILINKLGNNEYKYSDIVNIKSLNPNAKILGLFKEIPEFYSYTSDFLDKDQEFKNEKLILDVFKDENYIDFFVTYLKKEMNKNKKYYGNHINIIGSLDAPDKINDYIKKEIKDLTYVTSILIKKDLLDQEIIQEIKDLFKNISLFMENKTKTEYHDRSFKKIGKDIMDSFVKEVSVYQANDLSKGNQKEDLLRKLKSHEARKKVLDEEMKSIVVSNEYSIDNLPKESKDKVDRITKLVKSLNNQEVTEFAQERLLTIVKKYFSIDEDYRTNLKNVEGFNAQELMNQSLENIEKILLAKKEDNNIELITEMSVENRKLKYKTIN